MRKIYPIDLIPFLPYKKADATDMYYANIANRVLNDCLDDEFIEEKDSEENLRTIAVRLTLWFEDVVSCGGIWTAFTTECKRRYGRPIPFFDIDENDYYRDEVNREDVYFLLWHFTVDELEMPFLVNPMAKPFINAANKVFRLFEDEFEKAPVNDRWHDAFHPHLETGDLLYSFSSYLRQIFIRCNYLDWNTYEVLNEKLEKLSNKLEEDADFGMLCYDTEAHMLFLYNDGLLGLTPAEWAAMTIRIEDNRLGTKMLAFETVDNMVRIISDEDNNYFYLKDLPELGGDDKVTYRVRKDSLKVKFDDVIVGEDCFGGRLTKIDGEWFLNGISARLSYDDVKKNHYLMEQQVSYKIKENDKLMYERFRKVMNGKDIVFIQNSEELAEVGRRLNDGKTLFSGEYLSLVEGPTAILCTPDDGIDFIRDFVDCIKDEDNPFYDITSARENAIILMEDADLLSYSAACVLWQRGMLSDVSIEKDNDDYESGHKLVVENAQFILDYFMHGFQNKPC